MKFVIEVEVPEELVDYTYVPDDGVHVHLNLQMPPGQATYVYEGVVRREEKS